MDEGASELKFKAHYHNGVVQVFPHCTHITEAAQRHSMSPEKFSVFNFHFKRTIYSSQQSQQDWDVIEPSCSCRLISTGSDEAMEMMAATSHDSHCLK